jgi:hypothetical protein
MPADLTLDHAPPGTLRGIWQAARRTADAARTRTPLLWWAGWAALGLSLPLLALTMLDARQFQGVSVWLKPWKFHVSVALHLFTLAWCAALLPPTPARERGLRRLAFVAVGCTVFELVYITGRAALGLASHFEVSTPFTGAMYTLMGLGAVALTACAGVLGLWIARARDLAIGPVLQRGLAWGLILGWLMGTLAGGYLGAQTGHWVGGTASDAGGSWLFHWSRDGGDLRVAHFFALHAMQAVPLAAWVAARHWRPEAALRVLAGFTAAYVVLTVATFAQAVAGRPFLAGA